MKRPLYLSFALTAALLFIVPLINLMQLPLAHQGVKWWKQKFLYNMDFAHQIISEAIYPLGLSIDPGRVIIGKEGWLYLGDHFEQSISSKRTAATAHDVKTFSKIAESAEAWDRWLKLKGVTEFRILIGPDKDSVYPEYLPDWASHSPNRPTHDLMPDRRAGIYIDPTAALRKAKDDALEPLYYRTDTHWNALGAWIAFDELRKSMASTQPYLLWPHRKEQIIASTFERPGGDLANFLRIQNTHPDKELILNLHKEYELPVEQYDLNSGALTFSGLNIGVEPSMTPIQIKSPKALNKTKVLWLRDSFGSAMSPLIAATFSDVVQMHFLALEPQSLGDLVEIYRPDIVIITSVERDTRNAFFQSLPPD